MFARGEGGGGTPRAREFVAPGAAETSWLRRVRLKVARRLRPNTPAKKLSLLRARDTKQRLPAVVCQRGSYAGGDATRACVDVCIACGSGGILRGFGKPRRISQEG